MKEDLRNYRNHRMEEWLILSLFYCALNPMSKSMVDCSRRGIHVKGDGYGQKLLFDLSSSELLTVGF
jgi:hypothetical protein